MSDPVLVDRQDGVLPVTLNRPEMRNAVSGGDVIDALEAVTAQASDDRSVRVLVINGAGRRSPPAATSKRWRQRPGCSVVDPSTCAMAIAAPFGPELPDYDGRSA